jgi:hypothetical protein
MVDSLSKGKRTLSFRSDIEDTANNIYIVKVGEDNGTNAVTYFNFLVNANTMQIINPSGKLEGQRP